MPEIIDDWPERVPQFHNLTDGNIWLYTWDEIGPTERDRHGFRDRAYKWGHYYGYRVKIRKNDQGLAVQATPKDESNKEEDS